jgi:hypothetical protein
LFFVSAPVLLFGAVVFFCFSSHYRGYEREGKVERIVFLKKEQKKGGVQRTEEQENRRTLGCGGSCCLIEGILDFD